MTDLLQTLQRDVNEELTSIANSLELRIDKCVPQSMTNYAEVKRSLDELKRRVDEQLALCEVTMSELEESAASHRSAVTNASSTHVNDLKLVLEALCEIEGNLLHISWNTPAPIEEAKLLMDTTEWLNSLQNGERSHKIVGKIAHLLHKDLSFASNFLFTKINGDCRELISFPTAPVKGQSAMKIRVKDVEAVNEILTAAHTLQKLKAVVNKWSEKIFSDFCTVIVNSRSGLDCFDITLPSKDTYLFTSTQKVSSDPIDVEGVFGTLSKFFADLHNAIGSIELGTDCRPLTAYIGRGLEDSLMNLLLRNCISLAAPMTDRNDPRFIRAMEEAEQFRTLMITLNFWNDSAPMFLAYAEANDSVFINRRCLDILGTAKKLILEPFLELTRVGTGEEITEETINTYTDVFNAPFNIQDIAREDEAYPKFMQLQACSVSTSAVKIVELLERTISEGVGADNEMLKARLLTTAQNILHLYTSMADKHHAAAISSVPQAAAVYFNNNYYICHRLILLPFTVVSRFPEEIRNLQDNVYPLLVDNLWLLRESATHALEGMLTNSKRQLSTLLADRQLFVGLQDPEKLTSCKKSIKACCSTISSIRDTWKEVMAETVFCRSLGNIVSYFLSDLTNMFLVDVEDIRASDAEMSAIVLEETLSQLQEFFVIRGKTMINTFCDTAYFRIKEVIFCLNGSLQGISDRWCDKKGPLAQWLKVSEVRGIVKALFMNTEQRKCLLESLC